MTRTANAVPEFLEALSEQGFWGFVTLKFENGTVVHVRREENLKPHELPGINRGIENGTSQSS